MNRSQFKRLELWYCHKLDEEDEYQLFIELVKNGSAIYVGGRILKKAKELGLINEKSV